ncbi:hypothetical protein EKQ60_01225 [Staphylococcus hyicus]|uniref:hypothetical protein n=1 Tax=Staphylococcus hyicus TaxID=1284 RepID=UPI00057EA629|nr:hypothetical protein [Staphylococcus hyicus]AJC95161.1 hypothetical protein SHYC_01775 [Staphylococcus hyicus]RTX69706.1 hypothetical protein EKQ60_01225 [Staphylococcus hyicus]
MTIIDIASVASIMIMIFVAILILIIYLTKCNALVANFDMSQIPKAHVQTAWNLWLVGALSVLVASIITILLRVVSSSILTFVPVVIGVVVMTMCFIKINKYRKH